MFIDLNRLAEQATQWFLRNGQHPLDIAANVAATSPGLVALENALMTILSDEDRTEVEQRRAQLIGQGVPQALAQRVAQAPALVSSLDIVRIAADLKMKVEDAGRTYYAVGETFHLDWLRAGARGADRRQPLGSAGGVRDHRGFLRPPARSDRPPFCIRPKA